MSTRKPIDFQKEIGEKLVQRNGHSHTELDTTTFRASSVGYCPRQILLNKLGVKQHDAETQGRFQTGDFIHDWIQQEILPKHATKHENKIEIKVKDIKIVGHYDCFDPVEGIVYDFKSRGSWYKFDPPVGRHLEQLEVYMRALNLKDPRGLMVYVSKSDLTVETYPDFFDASSERDNVLGDSEEGEMIKPDSDCWESIVYKLSQVHEYLEEHGFPTSEEEVNAAFKPCHECVGCHFEDTEKWDFSHIKKEVNQ